ncbi:hypothetical protein EG856_01385 [Mycoplasmopsis phocirhinis]|uniref:Uncharacterized protein n=1 Tax=Mycoplasmopsis phocirhinis TaxID=142650 RepID=A0A4P6MLS5_9BACT|nr:hypothetical protein [Mycoplasmopsis phocirhinis]QBF34575.1 hypothetical protein EG856_01385 [Mycoplasmopsis phocirhinis]
MAKNAKKWPLTWKLGKKFKLELLKLCNKSLITNEKDLNEGYIYEYESKEGWEYNNKLFEIFGGQNLNDRPFTIEEIKQQPRLIDFKFAGKNDFIYICDLIAYKMNVKTNYDCSKIHNKHERIIPVSFTNENAKKIFEQNLGIAYLLTAIVENNEYIIKIGQSKTTFKDRLNSYNCGNVNNWRTASTTNIKILQSMLSTQRIFKLYICPCEGPKIYTFHGIKSSPLATPMSLAIEEIMLNQFVKQFKQKPLANIQIKPTKTRSKR